MSLHDRSDRTRLRGTSVLAAPLLLVAVIGLSLAVASVIWVAWGDRDTGPAVVAAVAVPALIGAAALVAIRGCFVEIDRGGGEIRDVVGWFTLRRIDQERVVTARVRRGPWHLYVIELDDGTPIKLVGASPQQFPARLLPDARRLDVADLDALLGEEPG